MKGMMKTHPEPNDWVFWFDNIGMNAGRVVRIVTTQTVRSTDSVYYVMPMQVYLTYSDEYCPDEELVELTYQDIQNWRDGNK